MPHQLFPWMNVNEPLLGGHHVDGENEQVECIMVQTMKFMEDYDRETRDQDPRLGTNNSKDGAAM